MTLWTCLTRRVCSLVRCPGAIVDCIEELRTGDLLCATGFGMRKDEVQPKYFGEGA